MSAVANLKPRILLVDDSLLMRKAAAKMLGDEFDVVTASDGIEAWDKIEADTSIQVIFTDLSMPRLDGYGLLMKVRASDDEGTLKMPVIVVTGAADDEYARRRALDLGATDFIGKPFGSIDLLARARAHANYRRIAKQLEQRITHDTLTGLANRAGLLERLQQDLAFARRHSQPLSLMRIEIDDFRRQFLTHGKATAEALVQHVARALQAQARNEDTAARIGLAGFALALPAGKHAGSRSLAERWRQQLSGESVVVDGKPIAISVTIAVSTPRLLDSLTAEEALDACEPLLQAALKAGGNRVVGSSAEEVSPPVTAATAPAPEARSSSAPLAVPTAAPPASAGPITPATSDASAVLVDEALHSIERGESQSVLGKLPQLITRLLPLLRLLNARQRAQLVAYLQKLGS